ncbi:MAG: hypothetical protein J6A97_00275 [Clostridia bacterium]|nr:hypothetical protein [Clostridia bacterium]
MAENISFRSSMNGFNRNDVMAYIDTVLAEKAELQIKVAAIEKDIDVIKAECEEEISNSKNTVLNFAETVAKLEEELSELKKDNESLRAVVSQANEKELLKNSEIAAEKELLGARENQYKAEIEELKAKISELENEKTEADNHTDKCADCDIAKVYEARLGAAMLDAKRFSEILVKEANDKASDLFADAFSSAHATSVKAGAIAQSITDISNQFNVSFKVLLDNMKALGSTLDSFKNDVKLTGEKFDFTTDFVAFTGETAEKTAPVKPVEVSVTEDIIPARKRNVNFDDADEFDFRVDVND